MDEELHHLFHAHKLCHYKDKVAELGVRRIEDLHHVEGDDLKDIGMRKIQVRAFEKMRQAAVMGPAPPNYPPPAALLPPSASLPSPRGIKPGPPNYPPPAAFLPHSASSKAEDPGELVQGVCGGMYVWNAEKIELYEVLPSGCKRAKTTKI